MVKLPTQVLKQLKTYLWTFHQSMLQHSKHTLEDSPGEVSQTTMVTKDGKVLPLCPSVDMNN